MTTRPTRLIGPVLLAASVVALAVSAWVMAARLSSRPDLKTRPHFWFNDRISVEQFEFLGVTCRVDTDLPAPDRPNDKPALIVHWRGQSERFEFGGRYDPRLPGMLRHEDWFRILPMVESSGRSQQEIIAAISRNELTPRLIIAARYPADGYDDGSWGLVRRREWRYRFAELLPQGPPEQSIRTWDTTYGQIERVAAPGPYDKPTQGLTDAQRRDILWQYDAMVQVTPAPLFRAKDKVVQEGMNAMGWTWPVAGASVTGIVLGAMLTWGGRVGRRG